MAWIKIARGWEIPESEATDETVFMHRRKFLTDTGRAALAAAALGSLSGCNAFASQLAVTWDTSIPSYYKGLYPAKRSEAFKLDRSITDEAVAGSYNNFYEFTPEKDRVKNRVSKFVVHPWKIELAGMVAKPQVLDLDDLIRKFPLEERLYRHRCVEAWSMAVPWTGFPMKRFIEWAQPASKARFVRFVSFHRPDQAPGVKEQSWYPWPYFEGLTMAEATNELAMLVTGIYGHPLPAQNGAPIRVVTPWKYGYKSIKSIVRIEFTDRQPPTFWNRVAPQEYDFVSNVNPKVPHPRWSQAYETIIGVNERRPTLPFNGYGQWVAHLY